MKLIFYFAYLSRINIKRDPLSNIHQISFLLSLSLYFRFLCLSIFQNNSFYLLQYFDLLFQLIWNYNMLSLFLFFIFNSLFSPINFLLSLNFFFVRKYVLNFEFDPTHFYNIIFLQKKISIFKFWASLKEPNYIIHSFSHLNWRKCRLSTLKITLINVLVFIKRLYTMNKKFVLNFSYCE